MFQNISKNQYTKDKKNIEDFKLNKRFDTTFLPEHIIIYVLSFMISMVGFKNVNFIAPFGISIFCAILSTSTPIGIPFILIFIGELIAFGPPQAGLFALLAISMLLMLLIKSPRYNGNDNEKRKLGLRVVFISFIPCFISLIPGGITLNGVCSVIAFSAMSFAFYKIFVNAVSLILNFREKSLFSIEEVISFSIFVAIAVCALQDFGAFGIQLKNIICLVIIAIIAWQNNHIAGLIIGAVIGTIITVTSGYSIYLIPVYMLFGGMIGVINRIDKKFILIPSLLGAVITLVVSNGNKSGIPFYEMEIALLSILALGNRFRINIEKLYKKYLMLPQASGNILEEVKKDVLELDDYNKIKELVGNESEFENQIKENSKIFNKKLQDNLEGQENNILFDELYSPDDEQIVIDIFEELLKNKEITREKLLRICAKYGNYIIGVDKGYINFETDKNLNNIIEIINNSYKKTMKKYKWKKVSKEDEDIKIYNGIDEIESTNKDLVELLDKEKLLSKEYKKPKVYKQKNGKILVSINTTPCEDIEKPKCNIKEMTEKISNAIGERVTFEQQICGIRQEKDKCKFQFTSADKLKIQIGVSKISKQDSVVSGDSSLQTKTENGKYLLALSDGNESSEYGKMKSKTVILSLENLLNEKIENERISNLLIENINEKYENVSVDACLLDLYSEHAELIKNKSCATYVKNDGIVQTLLQDDNQIDLGENTIIVMCSDGVIQSTKEYITKDLWIQFYLEDTNLKDAQEIADQILKLAINNSDGKPQDDMTVIVASLSKNKN